MEESKSGSKQANEWECKFCQHYMCRILWSYIALCVIAVGGYFVLVRWLGVADSSAKATIAIGLIAWTAAMIVPIAAGFAITDWREQQRLLNESTYAKELSNLLIRLSTYLSKLSGELYGDAIVRLEQLVSLPNSFKITDEKLALKQIELLDEFILPLKNHVELFTYMAKDENIQSHMFSVITSLQTCNQKIETFYVDENDYFSPKDLLELHDEYKEIIYYIQNTVLPLLSKHINLN